MSPDISPQPQDGAQTQWEQWWRTDQERFMEAVFRRFYVPLGRTVNRMLNDPAATEDIVQEVFVKIWHQRGTLQFTQSVKAYLYRAAINAALNHLEQQRRRVGLEAAPEPAHTDGEDRFDLREAEAHIQQAVDRLPPACKAVFVLSRYEEMSYREIAESLQISPKTVENQMGKALRHLRDHLSLYARGLACMVWLVR